MRLIYSNEMLWSDDSLRASLYVSPHIPHLFHFVEERVGKICNQKVSITWEKYKEDRKYIPTYRCVLELTDTLGIHLGEEIGEWRCINIKDNTCVFEIHSDHLTGMNLLFVIHVLCRKNKGKNICQSEREKLETELNARFFDIFPLTHWTEEGRVFCFSSYHQWQWSMTEKDQNEKNNKLLFLKHFYDNYDKKGFLDSVKWDEIDSFFCWPRILFDYPELNEKCHCQNDFFIKNQILLMIKHPSFSKYMQKKDWQNSYEYWSDILSYHPEGKKVCTEDVWENMSVEAWCELISNQPEFLDKCPMFTSSYELNDDEQEIIEEHLPEILIHQPQLKNDLESMIPNCGLEDVADDSYLELLSVFPEYVSDWADNLDLDEWAQLLVRQPQLWQYCPYRDKENKDAFSTELISKLVSFQPDLNLYME